MGRRDFQSTVAEVLPAIVQEEAKTGIGALRFFKKDRKTEGKMYFRSGTVYAIELSTFNPNIVNRVITNEYIKPEAREQILSRFEKTPTNWSVVKFVLAGQLFPEKPLVGYIKDYFLDAFDELYTWENVNAEFRRNEEPSIPTVPNVAPGDLIDKAVLRRQYLETEIATKWNSTLAQLGDLRFRRNTRYEKGDYNAALLLTVADGKRTISEATDYLGMSRFNVKKDLFGLWEIGVIDIIHPAGLTITNRSEEDLKNQTRPSASVSLPAEPVIQQEPVREIPMEQPVANEPQAVAPRLSITPAGTPLNIAPPMAPPVAAQPPVAAPATQVPAPVATNGGGSRIAQLAAQLRQELAQTDTTISAQREKLNDLTQQRDALALEEQSLMQKLEAVRAKRSNNEREVNEAQSSLSQLETERDETLGLLK